MTADVYIRDGLAEDAAFVRDAWLSSFRLAYAAGPLPADLYDTAYGAFLDRLLASPATRVLVAAWSGDETLICGFVVYMPPGQHDHRRAPCGAPLLLWSYVKRAYRGMGVARDLWVAAGVDPRARFCFAFRPGSPGRDVLAKTWTGGHFDPMVFRFADLTGLRTTRKVG